MLIFYAIGQIKCLLLQHGHGTLSAETSVGGVHIFGDCLQVELVLVAFPMDFVYDLLVIVVTDGTAQLIVVHAWFAFANAPQHGHRLWVKQLELPITPHPSYDVTILFVL